MKGGRVRRSPITTTLGLALALPLTLGACGDEAVAGRRVVVFAAASLAPAFGELATAYERRHAGTRVELHCAGTPRLVLQLREGAPADVLASADEPNMARVVDRHLVVGAPVVFARNRLAIVTAAGNPRGITGLADLARADLRVVLCGPDVPAGRYARQALAGARVAVSSVSDEPSVQAVVAKVRLGEVDAGIVYRTDVAAREGVDMVPLPVEHDVVATYPIAVLASGGDREGGAAFVAFVTSADGQAVLRRFGFEVP
ncbi:MAG: molybdate ABC transporter substrate-binding protein [Planctomycetota bacterium]